MASGNNSNFEWVWKVITYRAELPAVSNGGTTWPFSLVFVDLHLVCISFSSVANSPIDCASFNADLYATYIIGFLLERFYAEDTTAVALLDAIKIGLAEAEEAAKQRTFRIIAFTDD